MLTFFILTIIGGILKFIVSLKNNEVDVLDILALIYAIGAFIAMTIYYINNGTAPPI